MHLIRGLVGRIMLRNGGRIELRGGDELMLRMFYFEDGRGLFLLVWGLV